MVRELVSVIWEIVSHVIVKGNIPWDGGDDVWATAFLCFVACIATANSGFYLVTMEFLGQRGGMCLMTL